MATPVPCTLRRLMSGGTEADVRRGLPAEQQDVPTLQLDCLFSMRRWVRRREAGLLSPRKCGDRQRRTMPSAIAMAIPTIATVAHIQRWSRVHFFGGSSMTVMCAG